MEHAFVVADSVQILAANASAWGLSVDAESRSNHRYASYRAVQIRDVYEIDDTTTIRPTPSFAVYYPWRVYVGHSYETLFEGEADDFHVGVRANLVAWSAGIDDFVGEYHLSHRAVGHGLRPKHEEAIFAKTQQEIESNYTTMNSSPVPVLVEWREIPGRNGHSRAIAWKQVRNDCPGQRGCQPCLEWEFDYVEWKIQARKKNGNEWDADGSPPDVVLSLQGDGASRISTKHETYNFEWKVDPPLRIEPRKLVVLRGTDKDLIEDDHIDSLRAKVQEFLDTDNGVSKIDFDTGAAFMTGRCIR